MSSFLENRQSWGLLLIGTSIVKGVTGFLLLASTIIILLVIVAWQNGLPCYEQSRRRREDRINVVDVINIMTQNLIFVLMVLSSFLVRVWKELSSIWIHKLITLSVIINPAYAGVFNVSTIARHLKSTRPKSMHRSEEDLKHQKIPLDRCAWPTWI